MKLRKSVEVGVRVGVKYNVASDARDSIRNNVRVDVWDSILTGIWESGPLPVGIGIWINVWNSILLLRG